MMKQIYKIILSGLLVFIFLGSTASATFINDSFSTQYIPPYPGHCLDKEPFQSPFLPSITSEITMHQIPSNSEDIIQLIQTLTKDMTIGYIQNLTSFGPRVTSSEACDDAAKYIFEEFSDMGLSVRYHNWTESDSLFGSNIEATLYGIDKTSDEIYIVCGHFDSVSGSPGADDNAAGTSVVLSAAEIMSHHTFNNTVKFVAFSGEEQGLIGSKQYALEAYENEDNIVAVLNADMMGYAATQEGENHVTVFDNDESTWLRTYTTDICNEYNEYINLEIVHGGSSGRSDHASFHWAGFDAIFYFEYEVNPNYHSSHDTLDTMNAYYATNVSKLSLATLVSLSELTMQHVPEKPSRPTGQDTGSPGENYTYSSVSVDPDNDDIWYQWDWGDDTYSEWIGPFLSGVSCEISHEWLTKGSYAVRVRVKDEHELQSTWSEPLTVRMPIIKEESNYVLSIIIEKIFNKYPFIEMVFKSF